jgi:hypothetical protein
MSSGLEIFPQSINLISQHIQTLVGCDIPLLKFISQSGNMGEQWIYCGVMLSMFGIGGRSPMWFSVIDH